MHVSSPGRAPGTGLSQGWPSPILLTAQPVGHLTLSRSLALQWKWHGLQWLSSSRELHCPPTAQKNPQRKGCLELASLIPIKGVWIRIFLPSWPLQCDSPFRSTWDRWLCWLLGTSCSRKSSWPFQLYNASFLGDSYTEQTSVIWKVLFCSISFCLWGYANSSSFPSAAETLSWLLAVLSFPNFPALPSQLCPLFCRRAAPCSLYNQDRHNPGHLPVDTVDLLVSPLKYSSHTWM